MVEATKKMLANWKDFGGRTTRPDFWWAYLGTFLLEMAIVIIPSIIWGIAMGFDSTVLYIIAGIFTLAVCPAFIYLCVAMIAAEIRRIRDAGFPWWFFFACFIPTVGSVALIVFLCFPTAEKPIINFGGAEVQNPNVASAAPSYTDVTPAEAPVVDNSTWYCSNCGAENTGKFCASCGEKKPE